MAAALPFQPFSEAQFLQLGLKLRSNGNSSRWQTAKYMRQLELFQSAYTVHPRALTNIWIDLQTNPFEYNRIDASTKPEHLLLVYRWLSLYETEKDLSQTYGFGEKSIRRWCKDLTQKIAALRKIKIDPNWEDDDNVLLSTTVDGIHYKIDEPRPFSTLFKSHKEGTAGLSYEYALYTHKDKIAWVNGPYPAGLPDISIFREKLLPAVEKKQTDRNNEFRVIADDGYTANNLLHAVSLRNELDPKQVEYYKDRSLSRQEKLNGLTKCYKVLQMSFRHDRGNINHDFPRHKAVVEAICVTVQVELDVGTKTLFDPWP